MGTENWGPWLPHNGEGQPANVIGKYVHAIGSIGSEEKAIVMACPAGKWSTWHRRECLENGYEFVIRYRIRKPRGLIILEELIADLPEEVEA